MAKHVYLATQNMAGVRNGEMFEAEEDDPRVLSGRVEQVKAADVPPEVKQALHKASEAGKGDTDNSKP